jgi:hypothetical protein
MRIPTTSTPARSLALFMLLAASANAADMTEAQMPQPTPAEPEWSISVTPYFWAAGLSGDVGVFGRQPVDIDMGFSDVFQDLKFAAMAYGDVNNGTWGVFADLMYVHTESDSSIERTVFGVPTKLDASVETKSFTATLMGEYRIQMADNVTVDLMAGARIWSVDNDIKARLTAGGPPLVDFSGSDGDTWVDPMIGFKTRIDTNSPFYVTGWGMIGGFGAGADLDWDVMVGIGYDWNDKISSSVGYRALGVDYDNDGFVYDVVQQGIFLGTTINF